MVKTNINFEEQDIKILDDIINICLQYGKADQSNLPFLNLTNIPDSPINRYKEYLPFFHIIDSWDIADVTITLSDGYVQPNRKTKSFHDKGGFRNLYRLALKKDKDLGELELLKKQKIELEIENLKHQRSIRDKEETIRNLAIINARFRFLRNWWWAIIIGSYILMKVFERIIFFIIPRIF